MELYDVPEAAKKLGMSIAWLRQKMRLKEIRYLKIGRRVFVPNSTIDDILASSVIEPTSAIHNTPRDSNNKKRKRSMHHVSR